MSNLDQTLKPEWSKDSFGRKALVAYDNEGYGYYARPVRGNRRIGTLDSGTEWTTKKEVKYVADGIKHIPGFENARPTRFNSRHYTVGWGDTKELDKGISTRRDGHAYVGKAFGIKDKDIASLLKSLSKQGRKLHPADKKFLESYKKV